MHLKSLHIAQFRNLLPASLSLHPQFNLFYGENGSGKTSLLEAIHVLATGRSFRAREFKQIIQFGEGSCIVRGEVASSEDPNQNIRMGVERFPNGRLNMRLYEQECRSLAELTQVLPIQLINSESYAILEASPEQRRKFLNWVMFHVEPSFYSTWQRYRRALQQRNAALKSNASRTDISAWDREIIETGEAIDQQRQNLLVELMPAVCSMLSAMLPLSAPVSVQYHRGWRKDLTLGESLERGLERDKLWGHTNSGVHRADVEWFIGDVPAKNYLSRGQLKLFICSLLMARSQLLFQRCDRRSVFLIDDLCSELDRRSTGVLLHALAQLKAQVLITCIEPDPITDSLLDRIELFGVERGVIKERAFSPA